MVHMLALSHYHTTPRLEARIADRIGSRCFRAEAKANDSDRSYQACEPISVPRIGISRA
jgi:hypothetical protein